MEIRYPTETGISPNARAQIDVMRRGAPSSS
jgi:hypothetical protein